VRNNIVSDNPPMVRRSLGCEPSINIDGEPMLNSMAARSLR
jgi:hypothetical protein